MTYADKLKNPKWQKKRLQILERDDWQCQKCGDKENTLNIHHLRYIYNQDPWEYSNDDLLTLCCDCHEYEKEARKEYEDNLSEMLKMQKFMADDLSDIIDILWELSKVYHPQRICQALRWSLCNKNGVKIGRECIGKIVDAFESSRG